MLGGSWLTPRSFTSYIRLTLRMKPIIKQIGMEPPLASNLATGHLLGTTELVEGHGVKMEDAGSFTQGEGG